MKQIAILIFRSVAIITEWVVGEKDSYQPQRGSFESNIKE